MKMKKFKAFLIALAVVFSLTLSLASNARAFLLSEVMQQGILGEIF